MDLGKGVDRVLTVRINVMLAAKRSTCVVPEVDLRECTLHLPPQKVNKAEITRNPKQGCQWPPKRTCVRQKCQKIFPSPPPIEKKGQKLSESATILPSLNVRFRAVDSPQTSSG